MKVAYLINQYPLLSHTFIRREIQALEAQGVEVERISVRATGSQVEPADEAEAKRTWVVLQVGLVGLMAAVGTQFVRSPLAFLRTCWMAMRLGSRTGARFLRHGAYFIEACVLANRLRRSGSQHLHAHFGTNPATVALLTRMLGGPPYSFTVHGPEEFDHPFELGLPEKIGAAAFVVGVSSYGRSQLYRWITKDQWHKIHVVHCGLGASFFESAPTPVPDNCRLVCVGRLSEQKGQLLLLQAVHAVVSAGVRCQLVLVGSGPLLAFLQAEIKLLHLEESVSLIGAQGEERVRKEILQARAFVLPSFAEGLPVVLMEALALCRPVISTYVAGIPELVEPGTCGWLIPAGSVDRLADAIRQVLQTPVEKLSAMGTEGAKRVRESHHVATEAGKLRALFMSDGREKEEFEPVPVTTPESPVIERDAVGIAAEIKI
jgi:colanic acid/amylovoran biosynthesis glycosyltransferase